MNAPDAAPVMLARTLARRLTRTELLPKALLLVLTATMLFRELRLPGQDIDLSWMMATLYGFLNKIDFGHYLIISYGPLDFLTSGLFHPAVFHLTIAFELLCAALVVWPALALRWNPAFAGLLAACLLCNRILHTNDGVVFAAIFSTFLLSLLERRGMAAFGAAVIGVLSLSKSSFFFAAAPLFLLADLSLWVGRRSPPLRTPVLFVTIAVSFVLAGQPASSLPLYLRNAYEISRFYSEAMGSTLGNWGFITVVPFVACGAVLAVLLWSKSRRRAPLSGAPEPWPGMAPVLLLGLLWILFVAYKASFVRFDSGHFSIGWNFLLLAAPVSLYVSGFLYGGEPQIQARDIAFTAVVCALFIVLVDLRSDWREARAHGLLATVHERLEERIGRVTSLAGWLDPGKAKRFDERRRAELDRMAIKGLQIGSESIDLYPSELGPVIAAGLAYQPRPTMQSYLAYSPYLQSLDLQHWGGPKAPQHLLFELDDIDGRLPTLSLGPSMVEILARYDPVEWTPFGLHLLRRATARAAVRQELPPINLSAGQWIAVPNVPETLTLASIRLETRLLTRMLAFLDRPPPLTIETRLASGEVRRYRFIPSMAQLGFAISPDLTPLLGTAVPGQPPERSAPMAGRPPDLIGHLGQAPAVTAFRIDATGLARYAYGGGTVTFSTVRLERDRS